MKLTDAIKGKAPEEKLSEKLKQSFNENPLVMGISIGESLIEAGKWILDKVSITLSIDSPDGWENRQNIISFLDWVSNKEVFGKTRRLMLRRYWKDSDYVNVVTDDHAVRVFRYKGKLFWYKLQRERAPKANSYFGNSLGGATFITLHCLSQDIDFLKEIANEFKFEMKKDDIRTYTWEGGKWDDGLPIVPRSWSTVALNKDIKEEIVNEIKKFSERKDWYRQKGIPHKLGFLFEGPSGSGKTSLARALATDFVRNIYRVSLAAMSDATLAKALSNVPKGSFVLLEDFEKNTAVQSRFGKTIIKAKDPVPVNNDQSKETSLKTGRIETLSEKIEGDGEVKLPDPLESLTLEGVLNAIDGVNPLDDVILIFTSNDISNIDRALLRRGRIDLKYRIGILEHDDIADYVFNMTGIPHTGKPFAPIMGCDLSDIFRQNCEDVDKFISSLKREEC